MTKYLGIDYGLAHIGLATSEHTLATPLPSLANDQAMISRIAKIVLQEGITHIVCGIPEGKLVPQIEKFAKKLEEVTKVLVTLHPETLSTQDVMQKLHESGASLGKKKNDHAYAACLILEDYLELNPPVLY